jgi:hypothetical protein
MNYSENVLLTSNSTFRVYVYESHSLTFLECAAILLVFYKKKLCIDTVTYQKDFWTTYVNLN